ncbi:shikimate kinase [Nanoarchaeota archaeon]
MNIVLIGYRGTGKTAAGKIVAEKLGLSLVSLDAEIEKKIGMTISEFVDKNGWDKFRDVETEVTKEAAAKDNLVIDCGGGIIERPDNIPALKQNGKVIWFTAKVETIVNRIKDASHRPSLTGKSFTDEVGEVLERRNPLYEAAADIVIETDNLTIEQQAEEVLSKIK